MKLRDNTDNYWQVQILIPAIEEKEKLGAWIIQLIHFPSHSEWFLHFINANTVMVLQQIRETKGKIYIAVTYNCYV